MILPIGYDSRLYKLLDLWTESGLVPDKALVKGFMQEEAFSRQISPFIEGAESLILLGFRQFPIGLNCLASSTADLSIVENTQYHAISQTLLTDAGISKDITYYQSLELLSNQSSLPKRTVIIQWNWLIEQTEPKLTELSDFISQMSKDEQIVISHIPNRIASEFSFIKQGHEGTSAFFPSWIKQVTSHMHLGTTRFHISDDEYCLQFCGQKYAQ